MKTKLTEAESLHLIKLGVDKEKASLILPKDSYEMEDIEIINGTPIFQLEDFLNGKILPKEIIYDDFTYNLTITCGKKYEIRYATEKIYHLGTYNSEELIDAFYIFTCWYYGEFLKKQNNRIKIYG